MLLALLLVGVVQAVVVPAATAHGSCTARAFQPTHPSGNMVYSGEYDCTPTTHDSIILALGLQRRQVGGTWSTVSTHTDTDSPSQRNFTGVISSITFDCRKDYRTHTVGDASPGGHHNTANSSVLLHTC